MIVNMRSATLATVLQALLVFLVAVTQVTAAPLSFQRRKNLDVYNPKIIEPTESAIWKAGEVEHVSWDTTNAPINISNNGHVVLKTVPTDGTQSQWKHLAGPFDLRTGQVDVTLPADLVTGEYRIVLFGDSGNESSGFRISGVEPSPETPYNAEGSGDADPFGYGGV